MSFVAVHNIYVGLPWCDHYVQMSGHSQTFSGALKEVPADPRHGGASGGVADGGGEDAGDDELSGQTHPVPVGGTAVVAVC